MADEIEACEDLSRAVALCRVPTPAAPGSFFFFITIVLHYLLLEKEMILTRKSALRSLLLSISDSIRQENPSVTVQLRPGKCFL